MAASIEQKQALNVLVVDDEEDVLDLFQSALTPRGHKVTVASNGADAVAALRVSLAATTSFAEKRPVEVKDVETAHG